MGETTGVDMRVDAVSVAGAFDRLRGGIVEPPSRTARLRGTALLAALRLRPELRPLLESVHVDATSLGELPFRAPSGDRVELDHRVLEDQAIAAVHLRHALELALHWRLAPERTNGPARRAAAVLAARTALETLVTIGADDQAAFAAAAPSWMRAVRDRMLGSGAALGPADAVEELMTHLNDLLPLQGVDPAELRDEGSDGRSAALARAGEALRVATPTERLLTLGGDSRLNTDERTVLNKYGCSPRPRPWAITFSSCTASSSSDLGFEAAERSRQELLAACLGGRPFAEAFGAAMNGVRDHLAEALELDRTPGTEAILSPSGTDVELYALQLALAGHDRPLLNIVVAPKEIGSGSLAAAGGLEFSATTPLGGATTSGAPVAGIETDRVRVECLELREPDGPPLDAAEVDDALVRLVDDAAARGERVLLHLLDSSKTGMGGPSLEAIDRLQSRHPDLLVLVDAAQMRLSNDGLAAYLARGFMVIVSGSKFFTGAPFSGALLIPPPSAAAFAALDGLPRGFGSYISGHEIPERWHHLRSSLPEIANVGLLMRWQSALWEMTVFAAVHRAERSAWYESFGTAVRAAIEARPSVELVTAPMFPRPVPGWDEQPTIFSFLVHRPLDDGRTATLSHQEAGLVYGWLNRDITDLLPAELDDDDATLAAKACHIGQPVSVRRVGDTWLGALRIAPGARLASRVRFDPTLGRDPQERLARQIEDAEIVLDKIGLIVRHWDALVRSA